MISLELRVKLTMAVLACFAALIIAGIINSAVSLVSQEPQTVDIEVDIIPEPNPEIEAEVASIILHDEPEPAPLYSEDELNLLSRIIHAEARGMSDECQLLVGNVVLNRVADPRFPDCIRSVIYQKGQYAPTWNGAIDKAPGERAVANAMRLLEGERFCPENVVWQAEFRQGRGVWRKVEEVGGVIWFCW